MSSLNQKSGRSPGRGGSLSESMNIAKKGERSNPEETSKRSDNHSVFQSGNFSAKYIRKGNDVGSLAGRMSVTGASLMPNIAGSPKLEESVNEEESSDPVEFKPVATSDVESSQPVTITGGFSELPSAVSAVNASTGSLGGVATGTNRRYSVLSNMISSSVATTSNKLPGYLKDNSSSLKSNRAPKMMESVIRSRSITPAPDRDSPAIDVENPDPEVVEIVERHLNLDNDGSSPKEGDPVSSPAGTGYDSLKRQGGDITRGIYNWVSEQREPGSPLRRVASSDSLSYRSRRASLVDPGDEIIMPVNEMTLPGGFRRSYIAQKQRDQQLDGMRERLTEESGDFSSVQNHRNQKRAHRNAELGNPNFFTKNFIEFLTLYGHFAGEDLSEQDDNESTYETSVAGDDESLDVSEANTSGGETSDNEDLEAVLGTDLEPQTSQPSLYPVSSPVKQYQNGRRGRLSTISTGSGAIPVAANLQHQLLSDSKRMLQRNKKFAKHRKNIKEKNSGHKISNGKAFLLLLKAFVGTGVVLLPKSFSNGGLLFCNIMIVIFSIISYYCFTALISTVSRSRVPGYGDLGLKLYGSNFQLLILISLAMSQLGFSSGYVVFVAENLREVMKTITSNEYGLEMFMLIQLAVFLPLSLTRNIGKLSSTALIADLCIFLGLIYIYLCSSVHLISEGVSSKLSLFKSDTWTLFIGTAVFSYEGIGLLIPIQESMAHPQSFNKLLVLVMVTVTIIFVTLSSVAYLSYGDDVKTVILMNFPRNKAALIIQLFYALAILLSTPLQLFPAIKILENYLFHKNRKTWKAKIRRDSESRSLLADSNTVNYDSLDYRDLSPIKSYQQTHPFAPEVAGPTAVSVDSNGIMSGKSDSTIKWLKNLVRVGVVLGMCFIGYIGSSDLDRFVSLIGSFTCIPLIYIYPPILYLKCFKEEISTRAKCANYTILTLGIGMMMYTSFQTISNWSQ